MTDSNCKITMSVGRLFGITSKAIGDTDNPFAWALIALICSIDLLLYAGLLVFLVMFFLIMTATMVVCSAVTFCAAPFVYLYRGALRLFKHDHRA